MIIHFENTATTNNATTVPTPKVIAKLLIAPFAIKNTAKLKIARITLTSTKSKPPFL